MGPPDGEAWFEQTESIVGFAPQKPSAKRPIILRHWPSSGAIAYVFARTSSLGLTHLRLASEVDQRVRLLVKAEDLHGG